MKLQFKVQPHQTAAVRAVVDVFEGQPRDAGARYRIDPGVARGQSSLYAEYGARNADIVVPSSQLLANVQAIQRSANLPISASMVSSVAAPNRPNLDIEMETGTGKTYVYIKTLMELNKRYGWSKYIVVVPSVAIREGVMKTFEITADHFQQQYGTKPRAFIYNSSQLHDIEQFSSDPGIQVMIINIQAFNAQGKDARRIATELDEFRSRKPIDVIAANRPIVIIDEPQKIGAPKSLESLAKFNALMVLRYSATHKKEHVKVHRLDALDAYNDKLVKKIAVRGITVRGLAGGSAYLYVDSIIVSKGAKPRARVELQVQLKSGAVKRVTRLVDQGSNLHDISNGLEAYKPNGAALLVADVDPVRDLVVLSDGTELAAGAVAANDVTEDAKRQIQIREVIRAHLEKERQLFTQGVKVLSLFFIDEVAKYRDYEQEDTLGEYARWFESEYRGVRAEILDQLAVDHADGAFLRYLERDEPSAVHAGYFSIDKKTKRQIDNSAAIKKTGDERGQSGDVDAYDLILKDKERLLSLEEPVRFLFSHSALREGWDNPNVFVMGMLKKSENVVSRRQEIGRGLRLAVNQLGERMDAPGMVHDINELTVVTDESYTDFVAGLQREIAESLSSRPRKATEKYFLGKTFTTPDGESQVEGKLAAAIMHHLIGSGYVDFDGLLTEQYHEDRAAGLLNVPVTGPLVPHMDAIWPLVDALHVEIPLSDGRAAKRIPLNVANFERREFQQLWSRINQKAAYQVEFDSAELVEHCIDALDKHLKVSPMQYVVRSGAQLEEIDADDLKAGSAFAAEKVETHLAVGVSGSEVQYDLLGEMAERVELTRRTVSAILRGIRPSTFAHFKSNPEQFLTEASRLINEQKAGVIVQHLTYHPLEARYDSSIFTDGQAKQDFAHAGSKLTKHVYDYVVTDSKVERAFVEDLDTSAEVAVYAKLPRGFVIPTPVGNYNPDWAIAFHDGSVKHIYFVAETKGSLSSLQLKGAEDAKIESARKFFEKLAEMSDGSIRYGVATDYGDLMQLVSPTR
ncbi:restriction endonuclease subunit R [Agrococcus sediminis]|uniref:Restriction endonuclease subunit R n=1 Tax=Agrococcus sediminis TaxID=2599924 RepID=A0A5M8QLW9_9MICO|nr:DEAD/DEAH box helicase family protein [Agrococcus sediminis]KAA6435960.1 restriction endonuclease subunit R [Agrococcus sediminis]